jgi:glycine/D-amino acid oxidase-like deaminating enzyme
LRVAVLGGGGVGVCAAMEISLHGHHVDIFEQDAKPVWRASRVNEGKIHQGILYAKDPSLRTARTMIRGALTFTACLSRWIHVGPESLKFSTPFIYAVHKGTMVDVDRLLSHFAACSTIFAEMQAASGLRYLGLEEGLDFRKLEAGEIERILDPQFTTDAILSNERSVDPRVIADRLRAAALAEPRITFVGNARVTNAEEGDGRYTVTFDQGGSQRAGPYDHVVNALWAGRLAIDRRFGIDPPHRWIHRHKFGTRVKVALREEDLPSVTVVLGPFGDIVNFGSNGFYLSWYPIGMVESSLDSEPPTHWHQITLQARNDIFDRSFAHWSTLCPKLKDIAFSREEVDATSGVIFAWGDSDISDANSKLHDRYEIGIHSNGRYHSVNTGKYTMVPYLGLKVAERVLGRETNEFGVSP